MLQRGLKVAREEGLLTLMWKSIRYIDDNYGTKKGEREMLANFSDHYFESKTELDSYIEEFHKEGVREIREKAHTTYKQERSTQTTAMGDIGAESGEKLYALIRKKKPEIVVETGVANGFSSTVILSALQKNGSGKLISVDLPFKQKSDSGIQPVANDKYEDILEQFDESTSPIDHSIVIPPDKQPGWIVPDNLQAKWDLQLGRSQKLLPCILCDEQEIDMFIHDSDHRFPCQMFEYEIGWEHLSKNGVLLSHDIDEPWEKFAEIRNHSKIGLVDTGYGYMEK